MRQHNRAPLPVVCWLPRPQGCGTLAKDKKLSLDLGPPSDPIRQQGRDPEHRYNKTEWFETPQVCDRSRRVARRRVYHESYRTTSGHTFDHHFEQCYEIARELEAAGIPLGWGSCPKSDHAPQGQSEYERSKVARGKPSSYQKRLLARKAG
jgi:hypothetical protein